MAKQFYDQIPQGDLTELISSYQSNTSSGSFLAPFLKPSTGGAAKKPLSLIGYKGLLAGSDTNADADPGEPETERVSALDKYTGFFKKYFAPNPDGSGMTVAEAEAAQEAENDPNSWGNMFESFFVRAAVIIVGFIFVAIGLSMFRNPNSVVARTVEAGAAPVVGAARAAL